MKKNVERKRVIAERTVINQNGTRYLSIPKEFCEHLGIQVGDRLILVLGLDSIKIISHEKI